MREIKTYFSSEMAPLLSEIEEAFELIKKDDVIIKIIWNVPYSGQYSDLIDSSIVSKYTPQQYWNEHFPHL